MIDLSPPSQLWERAQDQTLLPTHAMRVARAWKKTRAWALVLLGGVGRGKSQAAAWLWHALRHEAIAHAQRPGHCDAAGEVLWLRARTLQRVGLDERGVLLGRLARCYGLVIDELGGEDHYDRASPRGALSDLIEERGDAARRTVITSNFPTAKELYKVYKDRLASRLHAAGRDENGDAKWVVVVEGADLRGLDEEINPDEGPTEEPVTEDRKREILDELEAQGMDRAGVLRIAREAAKAR